LILRTAPGVDDIITWGGDEKQFQVQIDPNALVKYKLSFKQVMEALTANNKQVGGQSINLGREQYLVRGLGLVSNVTDIGGIVVAERGGAPIRVRDVAKVVEAPAPRFGAVTRDGKEAVLGMALSRVNENAKTVVDAVKAKLAIAQAALPKGVTLKPIYDRTEIVEKALKTAESSLVEGAILVAVILFLFLGEFRSAIVVIVTLPLSMLIAFILMQRFGLSANLMSLAGLAIGTGMMVDGAVVHGRERVPAALACSRVRQADQQNARDAGSRSRGGQPDRVCDPDHHRRVPAALFPDRPRGQALQADGPDHHVRDGRLAGPVADAGAGAGRADPQAQGREGHVPRALGQEWPIVPLLDWALERKKRVIGTALVLLVGTLALFPLARQGVHAAAAGGRHHVPRHRHPVDLAGRIAAGVQAVDTTLRTKYPQVRSVLATIGRAEKGETADVNYMEVLVDMKPQAEWPEKASYSALASQMQEDLEKVVPTSVFGATQPIQMRVEELISGVRATLALKLYGEDLETLDRLTAQAKSVSGKGARRHRPVGGGEQGQAPAVIKVNREAASRYGINADEILEVVQAGIGGSAVSTLIDGTKRFDIAVRLADGFRADPEAIGSIPIRTAEGALVPFSQVATLELDEGYSFVRREALQRYAVLQMDVKGRDVDSFVKEADAKLKEAVQMPAGYWVEWGGAFENQQRALARLALIVPLTIGLIFLLLYTAFNSLRHATIIIANVPFAIIGGIIGLFVTGQYVSVPSAIGFIAVFGVAMLNGIVLVSFLNDQRRHGLSVREAVRQGAALRLRPVLMTASVAILGLIPMLLSTGVGAETQRPLATVVVGGLITSTALTLLLLPLIYEWAELRAERRKQPQPVPAIEGATP
jgi:cobalt-zinc-cadmium resistance protein CzcA